VCGNEADRVASRVTPAATLSCAGSPLLFSNGSTMTDWRRSCGE